MSGGQKQRVALARALAKMPKLLLARRSRWRRFDRKLREETRLELTGIQERVGTSFPRRHPRTRRKRSASPSAHRRDEPRASWCRSGTPTQIYERPTSRFVADFVGAVNLFDGALVGEPDTLALADRRQ